MNAVLFVCLLCCGQPPKDDPLLKGLDDDFRELLKKEKNLGPLREAAERLSQTNQNSRWTYYKDGLATLRRHRSPAGVALVLRYTVEHAGSSNSGAAEYAETFVILTGKAWPEASSPREAVAQLVKTWWDKDKVVTNLDKMSREQVETIVGHLLKRGAAAWARDVYSYRQANGASEVYGVLGSRGYDRRPTASTEVEELHPRMVEMILKQAGHDPLAKDGPPERETNRVLFEGVRMLAILRNEGEAPTLDAVARDAKQNSAVRLTCVLALLEAGEDRQAPLLLEILEKEKKLERRLTAIAALHYCDRNQQAVPKLVALLDDANVQIRAAAIHSLQGTAPVTALPHLKKILADPDPTGSIHNALYLVAEIGNKEAKGILADFLARELKAKKQRLGVYHALSAFQTATGQSWTEAGAHDEAYYRQKAEEALQWWRAQRQ